MKRSTLAAQQRFADYLLANPPAGGSPTGQIPATQITETTEKRFTNNQELASFAKLGPDGKVADAATKDFFFASEHFAIEDVVGTDNVTRSTFRIQQSIIDGLGGGGGGGTGPAPLNSSIAADSEVTQNNGMWGFGPPKNSVTFTITEDGGSGNYTRTWSFTGPAGNTAYVNGGPDAVHGPTLALNNMIKDGPWLVKCLTTDGTTTKEASFAFTISGNGNGTPGGGTSGLTLRMEYRTKTVVANPDDSIDFLLYPENGVAPYNYSTLLTGIAGGHGTEPLTDGAFSGTKAFAHSLRTSGVGQLTVTVTDGNGATASATKEIAVSGW